MEITKKAKQQLTASPAIIDLQGIVKRFILVNQMNLKYYMVLIFRYRKDSSYLLSESPVPANRH